MLDDIRLEGKATWTRFNAGAEDQVWYYSEIARRMRAAGVAGPMIDEFERVVREIERLA